MIRGLPLLAVGLLLLSACVKVDLRHDEAAQGTAPSEVIGAKWSSTPISYCTVRDGQGGFVDYTTFVTLVRRAIAAWGVPATYNGDCRGGITAGDGINEIGWGDLGTAPGTLHEAGNTNIRYRIPLVGAPRIVEADITIEREPTGGRDSEQCLYSTLLHETGHLLGVQHLGPATVMSPVISRCLQQLTPADRAALARLY